MAIQRYASGNSLVEVLDRVLDKGIVIDAWVAVSVIGIELITIEARVIIASVETYAKYAQLLGYLGPIAGGIRQPTQRKSLGQGLQEITEGVQSGLQGVSQNVQGATQSVPLLGNQPATAQSPATGRKSRTKRTSRKTSRNRKK